MSQLPSQADLLNQIPQQPSGPDPRTLLLGEAVSSIGSGRTPNYGNIIGDYYTNQLQANDLKSRIISRAINDEKTKTDLSILLEQRKEESLQNALHADLLRSQYEGSELSNEQTAAQIQSILDEMNFNKQLAPIKLQGERLQNRLARSGTKANLAQANAADSLARQRDAETVGVEFSNKVAKKQYRSTQEALQSLSPAIRRDLTLGVGDGSIAERTLTNLYANNRRRQIKEEPALAIADIQKDIAAAQRDIAQTNKTVLESKQLGTFQAIVEKIKTPDAYIHYQALEKGTPEDKQVALDYFFDRSQYLENSDKFFRSMERIDRINIKYAKDKTSFDPNEPYYNQITTESLQTIQDEIGAIWPDVISSVPDGEKADLVQWVRDNYNVKVTPSGSIDTSGYSVGKFIGGVGHGITTKIEDTVKTGKSAQKLLGDIIASLDPQTQKAVATKQLNEKQAKEISRLIQERLSANKKKAK